MFKKFSLFVLAAACTIGTTFAQTQPCGTDEHYQQLLKDYPQLAEMEEQFNSQLAAGFAAKGTAAAEDTTWYDVPLVVHIVHDYGFNFEFIPDNTIYEAVKLWALAYVKNNPELASVIPTFVPWEGNARTRLHLATIDPNGNPTKGVVRHYSYLTYKGSDQSKFSPWPNNKYMNIWFTRTIGNSGAAAYAYYPSSAAAMPHYDGVISLYDYIDRSNTIPHEIGHCLNLQHVWGNTNNPAVACGNDQVDDTPPTKGHTPGCITSAIYDTTCATGYAKTYTSSSGMMDSVVNYPDTVNAQNIMDYTYCAAMFTKGQCFRMRTALTSPTAGRSNLWSAGNLAATGALNPMPDLPPVAEFCVNKGVGGSTSDARTRFLAFNSPISFSFRNMSWNDTVTGATWNFSNGPSTPTSTSLTTVTNTFSVPGWVTVSLTATSNAGSNTIVNTQSVYAADTTPILAAGYSQNFASAVDIANWPMFNHYENQFRWQFYNGAGKDDNSCVRFRSFDTSNRRTGTATGDLDDFFTPAFDLTSLSGNVYFNFYTAGASTNPGGFGTSKVFDSLQVDVSSSGGAAWTRIGSFRTTDLANNGVSSTEFIPGSSSTWVGRSVLVPIVHRTRQTYFRFRMSAGNGGNNVYVDNVSISPFGTDVQDVLAANKGKSLIVYPNPSADGATIMFQAGNDASMKFSVRDMAGRVVYEGTRTVVPNSANTEFISKTAVGTPGVYIVSVSTGESTSTARMVVH